MCPQSFRDFQTAAIELE